MTMIAHKYVLRLKDAYDEGEDRIEVRVFGPISQFDSDSNGFWAGNWTPDELEKLGLILIQAAYARRHGISVEGMEA